MLNSLVTPPPCLFWRAGYPQIGDLNRSGRSLSLERNRRHSMVNAVSTTRKNYVEYKTAYTTCTHTREILPCDKDISLNEFPPGVEWTPFFQPRARLQQTNHYMGPLDARQLARAYYAHGAQDSSHYGYSRARKTQHLISLRRGGLPQFV